MKLLTPRGLIMKYKPNQIVFVNTGGKTTPGHISNKRFLKNDEQGNYIYTAVDKGHYWKEQDSYRVKFENGTTQYIPAECISDNILDFMNCEKCNSHKINFVCVHCGNTF